MDRVTNARFLVLVRYAMPALLFMCPITVDASLGGGTSSIDADRVAHQGALIRIAQSGAYATHEIQTASGTIVREYLSSTGTVFAVAWQGPWVPDLRQLLGPYFEQYQSAVRTAKANRRGHGPLSIEEAGLVVEVSGHSRAFSGRVYVPQLMPQGVQAENIR